MNRRTSLLAAFAVYGVTLLASATPRAAFADQPGKPEAVPHEVIIKAPTSLSTKQLNDIVTGAGCRIVKPLAFSPGYYLLSTEAAPGRATPEVRTIAPLASDVTDAVEILQRSPGIIAAPNSVARRLDTAPTGDSITPNDPLYDQQWGMKYIRMPEAWAIQQGVRSVKLAVIDTGLDPSHPDFAGRVLPESVDVTFDTPTNVLTDSDGHGTHVSGTAVAPTNNAIGVTGVAGWQRNKVDIKLLAIRASQKGSFFSDDEVEAINYAAQQGAGVVNMSFGGYFDNPVSHAAITSAYAGGNGVVFVAARGNDPIPDRLYPATYPEVIGVSALNIDGTITSYSNFGFGTIIAAPGGDGFDPATQILSTWPLDDTTAVKPTGYPAKGYEAISGTSMASPHVAGAVALLLAAGLPPINVRDQLTKTAKPIPDASGNNYYGAGGLDVYSALLPLTDPDPNASFVGGRDAGASFTTNRTFDVKITGVNKLQATPSAITVEIRTATEPSSLIRTLVGGTDFDIPTLPAGAFKATPVTAIAPRNGISLATGRYKAVLNVNYNGVTTTSQQFFSITSRRQPLGRVMFATPFQTTVADSANAEKALFGDVSFRLKRYEPLNITGGVAGDGYFTYSSAGDPQEAKASFKATGDDNAPLVFDTAAPNVSIAPIGLGYWLDLSETRDLSPVGTTYPNSAIGIRLFAAGSGWNMIGAPFTAPVDWGTVTVRVGAVNYTLAEAVDRQIISSVLVGFNEGDYTYFVAPQGVLDPFNGYWVRAFQDCTLVVPPNFSNGATGRAQIWPRRLSAKAGACA